jgi:hypothetical protein
MKISLPLAILWAAVCLAACQTPALPQADQDTAALARLRGTWVPVSLTLKYQVGVPPIQRDTTVTLTPATAPLLVAGRPNPIMPFTDTLVFAARGAAIDTFWTVSRGLRQAGNFWVTTTSGPEQPATLLRLGRPTYVRGQVTRWNYDFVFHGTVSPGANNAPVYTPASYVNYSPSVRSLTDAQLVLSFTTPGNVGNLPQVGITAANQLRNDVWVGRPVTFTATFAKR